MAGCLNNFYYFKLPLQVDSFEFRFEFRSVKVVTTVFAWSAHECAIWEKTRPILQGFRERFRCGKRDCWSAVRHNCAAM